MAPVSKNCDGEICVLQRPVRRLLLLSGMIRYFSPLARRIVSLDNR